MLNKRYLMLIIIFFLFSILILDIQDFSSSQEQEKNKKSFQITNEPTNESNPSLCYFQDNLICSYISKNDRNFEFCSKKSFQGEIWNTQNRLTNDSKIKYDQKLCNTNESLNIVFSF